MSGSDPLSETSRDSFNFEGQFNGQIDSRPPSPIVVVPINPVFERRTIRKIDKRLLSILGLLYTLAFVDYTNLSVARQEGADDTLRLLVGNRYLIVTVLFFVPYVLLQLPVNLALRRIGPSIWLGTMTFLLGALLIWMAFVDNWQTFIAVRVIEGIVEAAFLSGSVYLISCWYTRRELHTRIALFYVASVFVGSFANILALGFSKVHTTGTVGWRWIFAFEGIITIILSIYGYTGALAFPDKPSTSHGPFLSRDEVQLMRLRVELDRRDYIPDTLNGTKIRLYLMDIKLWAFGILAMCAMTAVYAYSYFLLTSLPRSNLGQAEIQLLFAPAGIFACVLIIGTAMLSDKYNMRGPFIVGNFLLTIIGICMVAFTHRQGVKFAGGFFVYGGAQANIPSILTYQSNNIRRHSKRIYAVSVVVGFTGLGGIIAAVSFPRSAFPNYTTGLWVTLALQLLGACVAAALTVYFWQENKAAPPRRPRTATPPAASLAPAPAPAPAPAETDVEANPAPPTSPAARPPTPGPTPASGHQRPTRRGRLKIIEGMEGFLYTI